MSPRRYLTTGAVAKVLDVSRGTVQRLIDNGQLPARRLVGSGYRRVKIADLREFVCRHPELMVKVAEVDRLA